MSNLCALGPRLRIEFWQIKPNEVAIINTTCHRLACLIILIPNDPTELIPVLCRWKDYLAGGMCFFHAFLWVYLVCLLPWKQDVWVIAFEEPNSSDHGWRPFLLLFSSLNELSNRKSQKWGHQDFQSANASLLCLLLNPAWIFAVLPRTAGHHNYRDLFPPLSGNFLPLIKGSRWFFVLQPSLPPLSECWYFALSSSGRFC